MESCCDNHFGNLPFVEAFSQYVEVFAIYKCPHLCPLSLRPKMDSMAKGEHEENGTLDFSNDIEKLPNEWQALLAGYDFAPLFCSSRQSDFNDRLCLFHFQNFSCFIASYKENCFSIVRIHFLSTFPHISKSC